MLALLAVVRPAAAALEDDFRIAWQGFHDLLKDERKNKYRIYWQELEKQFLAVYKNAPEGSEAPKALYYAGRVNEELGRRSYLDSDFRRAGDYYQRVVSRFPSHSWSDDCLYRKALIELNYLKNSEAARSDLNAIVRDYPKGDMLPKARELLAELDGATALARGAHSETRAEAAEPEAVEEVRVAPEAPRPVAQKPVPGEPPTPPRETRVPPKAEEEAMAVALETPPAPRPDPSGPNILRDIRHQSSDEYTRIVLNADRKVAYRYQLLYPVPELDKPHRLYIDLEETRLGPQVTRSLDIADGILSKVRIAQNTPTVTRVVLDFHDLQKYQIFAMEDPFRIIIDVSAPDPSKGQMVAESAVRRPVEKTTVQAPEPEAPAEPVKRPVGKGQPKAEAKAPEAPSAKSPEKSAPKAPEKPAPKAEPEPEPQVAYTPPPESKKQAATLVEQLGLTVRTIMIDPGHGGRDPGATGVGGVKEKNVNLRFAQILGAILAEKGFKVLYTREKDTFMALEDRTAKANLEKADLFISVHCNAIHLPKFSGIETYYLDLATSNDAVRVAARENAVTTKSISDLQVILTDLMLNSKLKESKDLAKNVHSQVLTELRRKHKVNDHGVRSAPFYVLMGAKMPAILVELGYLTNAEEAKRLQDDAYLRQLAQGLAAGVVSYKRNIERFASL